MTVIVTLGNFATKLLLQTKEGITKLRGTEFALTRAGHTAVLIPTLHPSAVLRSGGRSLAESRAADMSASRRLYHHHRYYRYYGAQPLPYEGYRPYPGRPYYYRPCYSCGPFVVPFLGFGFGW